MKRLKKFARSLSEIMFAVVIIGVIIALVISLTNFKGADYETATAKKYQFENTIAAVQKAAVSDPEMTPERVCDAQALREFYLANLTDATAVDNYQIDGKDVVALHIPGYGILAILPNAENGYCEREWQADAYDPSNPPVALIAIDEDTPSDEVDGIDVGEGGTFEGLSSSDEASSSAGSMQFGLSSAGSGSGSGSGNGYGYTAYGSGGDNVTILSSNGLSSRAVVGESSTGGGGGSTGGGTTDDINPSDYGCSATEVRSFGTADMGSDKNYNSCKSDSEYLSSTNTEHVIYDCCGQNDKVFTRMPHYATYANSTNCERNFCQGNGFKYSDGYSVFEANPEDEHATVIDTGMVNQACSSATEKGFSACACPSERSFWVASTLNNEYVFPNTTLYNYTGKSIKSPGKCVSDCTTVTNDNGDIIGLVASGTNCVCPSGTKFDGVLLKCVNPDECTHPLKKSGNSCVCKTASELGEDYFALNEAYDATDKTDCKKTCSGTGVIANSDHSLCICDTDNHFEGTAGNCKCVTGYTLVNNVCVPACDPSQVTYDGTTINRTYDASYTTEDKCQCDAYSSDIISGIKPTLFKNQAIYDITTNTCYQICNSVPSDIYDYYPNNAYNDCLNCPSDIASVQENSADKTFECKCDYDKVLLYLSTSTEYQNYIYSSDFDKKCKEECKSSEFRIPDLAKQNCICDASLHRVENTTTQKCECNSTNGYKEVDGVCQCDVIIGTSRKVADENDKCSCPTSQDDIAAVKAQLDEKLIYNKDVDSCIYDCSKNSSGQSTHKLSDSTHDNCICEINRKDINGDGICECDSSKGLVEIGGACHCDPNKNLKDVVSSTGEISCACFTGFVQKTQSDITQGCKCQYSNINNESGSVDNIYTNDDKTCVCKSVSELGDTYFEDNEIYNSGDLSTCKSSCTTNQKAYKNHTECHCDADRHLKDIVNNGVITSCTCFDGFESVGSGSELVCKCEHPFNINNIVDDKSSSYTDNDESCDCKTLTQLGTSYFQNQEIYSNNKNKECKEDCPSLPGVIANTNRDKCICDTSKNFAGAPTEDGCNCATGFTLENGVCVHSCSPENVTYNNRQINRTYNDAYTTYDKCQCEAYSDSLITDIKSTLFTNKAIYDITTQSCYELCGDGKYPNDDYNSCLPCDTQIADITSDSTNMTFSCECSKDKMKSQLSVKEIYSSDLDKKCKEECKSTEFRIPDEEKEKCICDVNLHRIENTTTKKCECNSTNGYKEVDGVCQCDVIIGTSRKVADENDKCSCPTSEEDIAKVKKQLVDEYKNYIYTGKGTCISDCAENGSNKVANETHDKCVCDTSKGFVEDEEGNCICDSSKGLVVDEEGKCVCDSSKGLVKGSDNQCHCDADKNLKDVLTDGVITSCACFKGFVEDKTKTSLECKCDSPNVATVNPSATARNYTDDDKLCACPKAGTDEYTEFVNGLADNEIYDGTKVGICKTSCAINQKAYKEHTECHCDADKNLKDVVNGGEIVECACFTGFAQTNDTGTGEISCDCSYKLKEIKANPVVTDPSLSYEDDDNLCNCKSEADIAKDEELAKEMDGYTYNNNEQYCKEVCTDKIDNKNVHSIYNEDTKKFECIKCPIEAKLITNKDELYAVNSGLNLDYCLLNDVSVGEIWKPIGNTKSYTGNFYGMGHVISNLEISPDKGVTGVGLFASITGKITDLGVETITVNAEDSNNSVGIIAGSSSGLIVNSYVKNSTLTFSGSDDVSNKSQGAGCIVGRQFNGTIQESYCSYVEITATKSVSDVGALVGRQENNATLSNCYISESELNINKGSDKYDEEYASFIGGIVGHQYSSSTGIIDTYSTCIISGKSDLSSTGGITGGLANDGTNTNSYFVNDLGTVSEGAMNSLLYDYGCSSDDCAKNFDRDIYTMKHSYPDLEDGNTYLTWSYQDEGAIWCFDCQGRLPVLNNVANFENQCSDGQCECRTPDGCQLCTQQEQDSACVPEGSNIANGKWDRGSCSCIKACDAPKIWNGTECVCDPAVGTACKVGEKENGGHIVDTNGNVCGCESCGENKHWDVTNKECVCDDGFHFDGEECIKCNDDLQKWDDDAKKCVCKQTPYTACAINNKTNGGYIDETTCKCTACPGKKVFDEENEECWCDPYTLDIDKTYQSIDEESDECVFSCPGANIEGQHTKFSVFGECYCPGGDDGIAAYGYSDVNNCGCPADTKRQKVAFVVSESDVNSDGTVNTDAEKAVNGFVCTCMPTVPCPNSNMGCYAGSGAVGTEWVGVYIHGECTWMYDPLVVDYDKDSEIETKLGCGVALSGSGNPKLCAFGGDKMLAIKKLNSDKPIDRTLIFGTDTVNPFNGGKKINSVNGFEALNEIAMSAMAYADDHDIDVQVFGMEGYNDLRAIKYLLNQIGWDIGFISNDNVTNLEPLGHVIAISKKYEEKADTGKEMEQKQVGSYLDVAKKVFKAADVWVREKLSGMFN